jgi:hypothetical protein
MQIKCNHVPRDIIYWYELTPREVAKFDYLDTEEKQNDASFFRYKRQTYDLSEFFAITGAIAPHCDRLGWEKFDGYMSNSFFSGVLVRYVDSGERVIAATYFA